MSSMNQVYCQLRGLETWAPPAEVIEWLRSCVYAVDSMATVISKYTDPQGTRTVEFAGQVATHLSANNDATALDNAIAASQAAHAEFNTAAPFNPATGINADAAAIVATFCRVFQIPSPSTDDQANEMYLQIPGVIDGVMALIQKHYAGADTSFALQAVTPPPAAAPAAVPAIPAPPPVVTQAPNGASPPAPPPAAAPPTPPAPTGAAPPAQPAAPEVPAPEATPPAAPHVGGLADIPAVGSDEWAKQDWTEPSVDVVHGPQHYFFDNTTLEEERELAALVLVIRKYDTVGRHFSANALNGFKKRAWEEASAKLAQKPDAVYKVFKKKLVAKAGNIEPCPLTDGKKVASRVGQQYWPEGIPVPDGYFDVAQPTQAASTPAQPASATTGPPPAPPPAGLPTHEPMDIGQLQECAGELIPEGGIVTEDTAQRLIIALDANTVAVQEMLSLGKSSPSSSTRQGRSTNSDTSRSKSSKKGKSAIRRSPSLKAPTRGEKKAASNKKVVKKAGKKKAVKKAGGKKKAGKKKAIRKKR